MFIKNMKSIIRRMRDDIFFPYKSGILQDRKIFVLSTDPRGRKLIGTGKVKPGSKALQFLWNKSKIFKPEYFFDVGANYGEISLFSRYGVDQHLFLVEANPRVASALKLSVKKHPDRSQIKVFNVAVGKQSGTVSLVVPNASTGLGSVFLDSDQYKNINQTKTFDVTMKPLDKIWPSISKKRMVMKLDIEGAELDALVGANRLLEENQFIAFVEIQSQFFDGKQEHLESLFSLLNRHSNGRIFVYGLHSNRFHNIGHLKADQVRTYLNEIHSTNLDNNETTHYAIDAIVMSKHLPEDLVASYLSER